MLSDNELATLIAHAIIDQPMYDIENLTIKIQSIIKGFRLNLNVQNFNKIEKPNEVSKLRITNKLLDKQRNFYRNELHKILGIKKLNIIDDLCNDMVQDYKEMLKN